MEAGLECFGTVGYFSTSIEGLCSSAHVSNRSFYEHFETKEDLLIAVYDELLEDISARVVSALSVPPASVAAYARAGLQAFTDGVLEDDRGAQIVIRGLVGVSPRCERHRREVLRAFAKIIGEGFRRADSFEAERHNLDVLSIALVGATIEALIDWLNAPEATIGEVLDELVQLYAAAAEAAVGTEHS